MELHCRHQAQRTMPVALQNTPARVSSLRRGFTLVELLVVIAIIGILVALLLPAINAAREAARQSACMNNIRQLGIAVTNYEANRKAYPRGRWNLPGTPKGKHDVADRPSAKSNDQSWTVTALPYVEEQNIAKIYDLKKPWFHPDNRAVIKTPISLFQCPSAVMGSRFDVKFTSADKPAAGDYGSVNAYNRSLWTQFYLESEGGAVPKEDSARIIGVLHKNLDMAPTRVKDICDGLSKTIIFGECAGRPYWYEDGLMKHTEGDVATAGVEGAGWADPDAGFTVAQATINKTNSAEFYSFHRSGAMFCFADASTRLIADDIDQMTLLSLITRSGKDDVSQFKFQ